MPFDANLVLANDDADWTYANIVTGTYGQPTSTSRNDGGFVVLDMGSANLWQDRRGLAIVVIFLDSPGVCLFNIDMCDDCCNSVVLLGGSVYEQ